MRRIALWSKYGVSAFVVVWIPVYWQYYGPVNFLWFCDLANILIVCGLWLESSLLLSSQGVAVLIVQVGWSLDVAGRGLFGVHLIGGTEYMFDPSHPLGIRLLSLFHLAQPPLLLWAIGRLGYDRRGWLIQTGITWLILPLCFVWTGPERNINWVWGPFGTPQTLLDPRLYVCVLFVGYPLLLYLPTHLLLMRVFRRRTAQGIG